MTDNKLLILDDDPLIGRTIAAIARSANFDVHVTMNATEFFTQLDQWQPTHIALDLVMPDMDGVEVLVELARRECAARIIISSGVGSRVLDAAARSASEHGLPIAGVLSKPFSPQNLRELLAESTCEPASDHQSSSAPARPAINGEDILTVSLLSRHSAFVCQCLWQGADALV